MGWLGGQWGGPGLGRVLCQIGSFDPIAPLTHVQKPDPQGEAEQGLVLSKGPFLELQQVGLSEQLRWPQLL